MPVWLLLLGVFALEVGAGRAEALQQQTVGYSSIPVEERPMIAVCLSGQLRLFPHVASSLVQNFLGFLGNNSIETHVYLSSFVTDTSTGIHLLLKEMKHSHKKSPNVKLIRVHMPYQYPNNSTHLPKNRITGNEGTSALFNLTQTCSSLIVEGEKHLSVQYDTVIRTRIDGLWTAPPKRLPLIWKNHTSRAYVGLPCFHHPQGYNFHGINDRFSVGPRDVILAGSSRLESIKLIPPSHLESYQNSETSLAGELSARHICTVPLACAPYSTQCPVPFCLARSVFPPPETGGPIFNHQKKKYMSEGGKCFVGDCYDPRQCGKMAQMHSPAFRALSFPPLENCTKELEEGFHSLNVLFTSDAPIQDICDFSTKYPSSDAFRRAFHAWDLQTEKGGGGIPRGGPRGGGPRGGPRGGGPRGRGGGGGGGKGGGRRGGGAAAAAAAAAVGRGEGVVKRLNNAVWGGKWEKILNHDLISPLLYSPFDDGPIVSDSSSSSSPSASTFADDSVLSSSHLKKRVLTGIAREKDREEPEEKEEQRNQGREREELEGSEE